MAVLWVNEGYQANFDRKVKDYTEELEDIQGRYESSLNLIDNYGGSSINNCDIYLRKRKRALATKISEATTIQNTAHTYVSGVISTDQSVARSIHRQSYDFYQAKGIGPQSDTDIARAWNSVCTTAEDFWRDAKATTREIVADIKEFYEEHKYVINLVFDALAVLGSVALLAMSGGTLFGVICGIGAVWALSKATYETVTDSMALSAHLSGDDALAEELAEKTLAGALVDWGEALDQKWGTHFMETTMKVLTIGLEVCEFVVAMVKIYDSFREIFKLKELNSLNLQKCGYRTWNQNRYYLSNIKWGGTATTPRFKSAINWAKFTLKNLGFSYAKDASSFKELLGEKDFWENVETIKDIINGKSLLKLNPLTKTAIDFSDDFTAIVLM